MTTNVHKHGPQAAAEFALDRMVTWRNRVEVSVDDYGDVYVRRHDYGYGRELPYSWLVGVYSRHVPKEQLVGDIQARTSELRPIYRRQTAGRS